MIEATNVTVVKAGATLLQDVSFTVPAGTFCAIVGPNGAGKSTLAKALTAYDRLTHGLCTVDGEDIAGLSSVKRAQTITFLPQARAMNWPMSVEATVALGRFALGGAFNGTAHPKVEEALERYNLDAMRDRAVDTLSGGEQTRVHLARMFVSEAKHIIVDEPIAALDARAQHQTLRSLKEHSDAGGCVIAVLHELPLAWQYADKILILDAGSIVADAPPSQALTAARISETFGLHAKTIDINGFDQLVVTGAD